jgi:hypothetical protein
MRTHFLLLFKIKNMKTNDEKTQELIALRKYVRKKFVQTTGLNPYPEILVDNSDKVSAQDTSNMNQGRNQQCGSANSQL